MVMEAQFPDPAQPTPDPFQGHGTSFGDCIQAALSQLGEEIRRACGRDLQMLRTARGGILWVAPAVSSDGWGPDLTRTETALITEVIRHHVPRLPRPHPWKARYDEAVARLHRGDPLRQCETEDILRWLTRAP
jgi:hypothetical protein